MKKVIFIHVPRTAGSSIREYAKKNLLYRRIWERDLSPIAENTEFLTPYHVSIDALIAHGYFTEKLWRESFKFVFIRNPWDRLVSIWKYYKSFRREGCSSTIFLQTFEIFVNEVIVKKNWIPKLRMRITRPYFQFALPQVTWAKKEFDFVGRFENLTEDWKKVCRLSGMPYKTLGKQNETRHGHYREYYTDKMAKVVGKFYEEDIDRFYYSF